MTTLMSFLCGALSASRVFCFPAIVSSSIVLILPVGTPSSSMIIFDRSPRLPSLTIGPLATGFRVSLSSSAPSNSRHVRSLQAPCGSALLSCFLYSSGSDLRLVLRFTNGCLIRASLESRTIRAFRVIGMICGIGKHQAYTGVRFLSLGEDRGIQY